MRIVIDGQVKALEPGIRLGIAMIEGVRVVCKNESLEREFQTVLDDIGRKYNVENLAQEPKVQAVRTMYKALKMDPARYRPASEAMLRRVLQGKGLYAINTVVDINNMASLFWGLPSGIYDVSRIQPPVRLRLGNEGEEYDGITGSRIHAAGKLVLADAVQVFGSPTTDSVTTKVDLDTRDVLLVQYIPSTWPANGEEALAWTVNKLLAFNGGHVTYQQVIQ